MGIDYMISDTDLATVKVRKFKKARDRLTESGSFSGKRIKLQNQTTRKQLARKQTRQKVRHACFMVPFSIALGGIAVFAHQCFLLLRQGFWKSLPARLLLNEVLPADFLQWLRAGNAWLHASKIVPLVFNSSLALFLLVSGIVLRLLIGAVFDLLWRPDYTHGAGSWRG